MRRVAFATALFVFLSTLPVEVFAHAYGTGGVDQYIRILPKADRIQVELDMHFAEIPAAAMSARIDTNADTHLSSDELYDFLEKAAPSYLGCLALFHGEGDTLLDQMAMGKENSRVKSLAFDLVVPVEGVRKTCTIYCPLGEKGQPTIRIRWLFEAKWPTQCRPTEEPVTVRFRTSYVPPQCSRRIVYAEPEAPLAILESNVPVERDFPRPPDITPVIKDKSQIPLVNRARLVVGPKPPEPVSMVTPKAVRDSLPEGTNAPMRTASSETASSVIADSANRTPAGQSGGTPESRISRGDSWLKEKVHGLLRPPLSPVTWPLAILFSLFWGAMHALTPGHGKTIAAAYLAGASASHRHALILGLATTLSHTAIVFVLAAVGYAMRGAMTYPVWLEGAGAAVILVVGLNQIRIGLLGLIGSEHRHEHGEDHTHSKEGVHDHEHGAAKCQDEHEHTHTHWGFLHHTHTPAHHEAGKARGSLLSLAVVGVSGGMVPCPAAIILLLLSWQLAVPGLGIACLLSFSLGLAGTLVGVGLLAVSGKNLILRLLDKDGDHHVSHAFGAWLPILGGLILIAMGIVILIGV